MRLRIAADQASQRPDHDTSAASADVLQALLKLDPNVAHFLGVPITARLMTTMWGETFGGTVRGVAAFSKSGRRYIHAEL